MNITFVLSLTGCAGEQGKLSNIVITLIIICKNQANKDPSGTYMYVATADWSWGISLLANLKSQSFNKKN